MKCFEARRRKWPWTVRTWWMLAGSMALTVTAVGFVAAGGAMPVGLIVVAAVPWVTVVGQEIEAFRHERESPVASRESVGT